MTRGDSALPEGYALAVCGLCGGAGKGGLGPEVPCPPCEGSGKVLIHQPPLPCQRCSGSGKASSHDRAIQYSDLCLVCQGAGWVMPFNG